MSEIIRGNNLEYLRFRMLCILKNNGEIVDSNSVHDESDNTNNEDFTNHDERIE